MADHLTPKQALFVVEYLKDLNGTQAAIRAGYSENTAQEISSENLSKPIIARAIKDQMDARAKRTLVTADYVLGRMQELAERCLQKRPVMVYNKEEKKMEQVTDTVEHEDGTTTEEGVWEFDTAGANKALENMARHLKLLTDRTEHAGHDGGPLIPPDDIIVPVRARKEENTDASGS
jgi:phage terminase small subunit